MRLYPIRIALIVLACAGCSSDPRTRERPLGDSAAPPADDAGPPADDAGSAATAGEILTQRYDNARSGANLGETALTQANVAELELLGSWPVDGEIYAQILIADAIDTADGARAVALVATMNDSLYAFDADAAPDAALLWHTGEQRELGTPGFSARNVGGLNGILSTPVIDKDGQRVLLVARNCPGGTSELPALCEHRLFGIALASGEIEDSVAIEGYVEVDDGAVMFDPAAHWNRPGLLLADDQLYIAFGSGPTGNQHEEDFVYHGWVFRFDARDLSAEPEVFCTTPRGRGGSVWQSGVAPAADENAIYFTGANGIMDDSQTHPPADWPSAPQGQEDSVVALARDQPFPAPDEAVAQYADLRSYHDDGNVFQYMESGDVGFGSSGPLLIPDTDLLVVGSKAGLVYLIERGSMRALDEPLNPFRDQPLQDGHSSYLHGWSGIPMITQSFVFWRPSSDGARFGYAYAWASRDRLRALRFEYATRALTLHATADAPAVPGGGNLVLSAAGDEPASGVLWAATRSPSAEMPAGELLALEPRTLEVLWRKAYPAWSKFNPPTVARGRVYLPSTAPGAAEQQVLVYGLRAR